MKRLIFSIAGLWFAAWATAAIAAGVILPQVFTPPSTGTGAGFNIPCSGVAPASPNNGDIWCAGSSLLAQLGGTSVSLASTSAAQTLTNKTISGANNTLTNIGNSSLTNSSVTLGSTTVSLGATAATLGGINIAAGSSGSLQNIGGASLPLQSDGTTGAASSVGCGEWSNDGQVCFHKIYKSRGTSIGALGAVNAGDQLGIIQGVADDGSTAGGVSAAQIAFAEEAAISAGNAFGEISFWTKNGATMTDRMDIHDDGGVVLNAATGGDKGVGTLNVSANIYLNGTAYTNPDYVLEKAVTGKIVVFANKEGAKDYPGLMPIEEAQSFVRTHYVLPEIYRARMRAAAGSLAKKHPNSIGLFDGGDALLASIEENYLYTFGLNDRIERDEQTIRDLRARYEQLSARVSALESGRMVRTGLH